MERLGVFAVGTALAITLALLSVACAVAVTLAPDATLDFFGAFMHGIDLSTIKATAPMSFGRVVYGVVGLAVVGFFAGVIYATAYNLVRST